LLSTMGTVTAYSYDTAKHLLNNKKHRFKDKTKVRVNIFFNDLKFCINSKRRQYYEPSQDKSSRKFY